MNEQAKCRGCLPAVEDSTEQARALQGARTRPEMTNTMMMLMVWIR